jgi:hypothetical protein
MPEAVSVDDVQPGADVDSDAPPSFDDFVAARSRAHRRRLPRSRKTADRPRLLHAASPAADHHGRRRNGLGRASSS